MNNFKTINPDAIGPLLERAKSTFKSGHLFWPKKQTNLSFVCGKNPQSGSSFRNLFLDFNKNKDSLTPVLAEVTFHNLLQADNNIVFNLADLEHLIAQIADSILIFVESPGSMAEIGFFSAMKEISAKSIIIIPSEYQGPSFINTGPAAICEHKTKYKPGRFVITSGQENTVFSGIIDSLSPFFKEKKSRTSLKNEGNFKKFPIKEQFYIIRELIYCFSPIPKDDLFFLIKELFGTFDKDKVIQCLAILTSIPNGIHLAEDGNYTTAPDTGMLIEYSGDELRAEALVFYNKHMPSRYHTGETV
ncbi:retron St85 family effector protein [Chromobacterium haemolyticum]|uniref:retron St85 family effector protein n=1 Tax=Chromobacterium haemolyticum TaxID=394935 RepID=UPI002446F6E8|nr:retron St85 family effector protein [Chromobacterium haemolyticum]MDH0340342.1 retron St85 family effector protein [Chromobacterium haemolyticum]